jgi:hypothetical protein
MLGFESAEKKGWKGVHVDLQYRECQPAVGDIWAGSYASSYHHQGMRRQRSAYAKLGVFNLCPTEGKRQLQPGRKTQRPILPEDVWIMQPGSYASSYHHQGYMCCQHVSTWTDKEEWIGLVERAEQLQMLRGHHVRPQPESREACLYHMPSGKDEHWQPRCLEARQRV